MNSPYSNPLGSDSDTARVLRGCLKVDDVYLARSTKQSGQTPDVIGGRIGFRCIYSFP